MKLIIEPEAGAEPLLAAIRRAKTSVEIAIFRFDRRDVELALRAAAAAKGVGVTAVIAFANRGNTYTQLGEGDKAIADLGEAIRLDSGDPQLYNNRGSVYGTMGEHTKAIVERTDHVEFG